MDAERITGQIAGYSGQTFSIVSLADRTVVMSDWFQYSIIVLLYELLRESQLTLIIIVIVK